MTFSITGHCARTGMFGVAITTSSICVGARCPHARAGVGAVATQNITDPHLAELLFERLAAGSAQVWMTGTEAAPFEAILDSSAHWHVVAGAVSRQN